MDFIERNANEQITIDFEEFRMIQQFQLNRLETRENANFWGEKLNSVDSTSGRMNAHSTTWSKLKPGGLTEFNESSKDT